MFKRVLEPSKETMLEIFKQSGIKLKEKSRDGKCHIKLIDENDKTDEVSKENTVPLCELNDLFS